MTTTRSQTNMYSLSVTQWNPWVGCRYKCDCCRSSFQAQLKRWAKGECQDCYDFVPHRHPERLTQPLPRTHYLQFIFACASSDIAFCPKDYLQRIIDRIRREPDKTFLIQSKSPDTFNRVAFPKNVILGTTLETNRDDLACTFSKAPKPSQRYHDLLNIKHRHKMVTIEPVMEFDLDTMISWITEINPCMVWLGYDSRNSHLPEPDLEKVKRLHWELGRRRFTVMLKTIRERRQSA